MRTESIGTDPLTTAQVAELFGVARGTVTSWIRGGRLAGKSDGERGSYLVDAAEVERFRGENQEPPRRGKPAAVPVGELGKRISELMTAKGYDQPKLAAKAGVRQSRISALLRGITLRPSADSLAKIAKALGVSTSDLLGETPPRAA